MSFDSRQDARRRVLDRVILAVQVLMVVYLGAHLLIVWKAFEIDGVLAAVLTLVLLGFGDLYWGLRWAYEGSAALAAVALVTALVCFTSWATRRAFNRWAMSFTMEMLDDFSQEMGRMSREMDERERTEGGDIVEGEARPHGDAEDGPDGPAPRP